jgi:hypothetical protein
MNKTDVFVVTVILAQAVAPHDIPLLFALLATFALLRGGLLVATRRGSSNMRVLRSLFATFASVAWLIVAFVALQLVGRP